MEIKLDIGTKKYGLIVIDPPWPLQKIPMKIRPRQKAFDYPVMTLDEIRAIDVASIADSECWLFLWTIQKYLFVAREILEGWGFNYLCMMVWQKTYGRSAGMPLYGFRWNAEFILVGYNEVKPSIWRKGKLIPLVFQAPNERHSQKPDIFYEMVEVLAEPRIDLFARRRREGWDVWGNEVVP